MSCVSFDFDTSGFEPYETKTTYEEYADETTKGRPTGRRWERVPEMKDMELNALLVAYSWVHGREANERIMRNGHAVKRRKVR
ncbi:Hypothetical protein NTJ_13051 [Nesidiocoris tenuis]|uniref:Uncharacterized protein n=1 Tax=Nesidiocoris tenuis TaxID=355587 RepID=A0ABN7B8S3_9HEMI|nr:Hypothetical protein NTJ_13051 [Nesidiocoris tenuis]